MEKYFQLRNLFDENRAIWVAYQLSGEATTWWDNERTYSNFPPRELTWDIFLQLFQRRWLLQHFFNSKINEFQKLAQGDMTVTQYWENFSHLLKYVTQYQMNDNFKVCKIILGLKPQIGAEVEMHSLETMVATFEKATMQEQKLKQIYEARNKNLEFKKRKFQNNNQKGGTQYISYMKRNNTEDNKGHNFNKNNNRGNNNYGNNKYNNKNNNSKDKLEYKKGPRDGCFICGGNHYAN